MALYVTLLSHTPNPVKTIAAAAKLCYSPSSIGDLTGSISDESAADFVEMLLEIGHESPTEHVSFTFGIEGVSRALLAQLTRHRIASYSVQSQRYVKENSFDFVVPPEIESIPEAKEEFLQAMAEDIAHYESLSQKLYSKHFAVCMAEGLDERTAKRAAEKKAIEDARFVLPNAAQTKIIMTMNVRSLQNFFYKRACFRAQWEIRELAVQMLKLVKQAAPELFYKSGPPCVSSGCKEGKMSCKKAAEVKKFFLETITEDAK